ncbi:MAG: P-II family nitrogen regulator [Algisphaera sp.]
MKLIVAIIQPDKLDEVRQALIDANIGRVTVSRCTGHGRTQDIDLYRGQEVTPNLVPKVRLEIAVNDSFVENTVKTIVNAAQHLDPTTSKGERGDGKIIVLPIEDIIRISTGEHGNSAV